MGSRRVQRVASTTRNFIQVPLRRATGGPETPPLFSGVKQSGPLILRCIKVAVINGRVTGMVTAQLLISTAQGGIVALVEDMVVTSAMRNLGIGRQLMAAIERWALKRDVTRVQLLAERGNKGAWDFLP